MSIYLTPEQRGKRIMEAGVAMYGSRSAFARAMKKDPRNLDRDAAAKDMKVSSLIAFRNALSYDTDDLIYK
jgi:hypothetical protein